ncbi:unnamed protein product [Discula destructiva]
MYIRGSALAAVALPTLAVAGKIPQYDGMTVVFSEDFAGSSGDSVDTSVWNIATAIDTNGEEQTYTAATRNLQLSGGDTVQLVPWKSDSGHWTSGRIETQATWTPEAGKKMRIEASARTGGEAAANAQGMWSAIWMMGDAVRSKGVGWPSCGEIDIMEMLDGITTTYGTVHCTAAICQPETKAGYQGSVATDNGWHTYGVLIDRTETDWTNESINFMKDGTTFFTVTGAAIGDEAVWATLAHSSLYMIINQAVGGSWPGSPNAETVDGYGNMLEIDYVAVYST